MNTEEPSPVTDVKAILERNSLGVSWDQGSSAERAPFVETHGCLTQSTAVFWEVKGLKKNNFANKETDSKRKKKTNKE